MWGNWKSRKWEEELEFTIHAVTKWSLSLLHQYLPMHKISHSNLGLRCQTSLQVSV